MSLVRHKDYFILGTIFKVHGYKGNVNIYNENKSSLTLSELEILYIEENKELIPYFIEKIRRKKKNILLVKFEDINSEIQAKKILKKKVFLPKNYSKIIEIHTEQLIEKFIVIDQSLGEIGVVDFVDTQSAQKLIIVKDEEKKFFIPFHDNFVINIDLTKKILEVNIPQELIDIN